MDPNQPYDHTHPDYANTIPVRRMQPSVRKKIAVWLMIGPTALFVVTFILYVIALAFADTPPADTSGALFATPSPLVTFADIVLLAVTVIAMLTWLPAMVIGIVLLATKKRAT